MTDHNKIVSVTPILSWISTPKKFESESISKGAGTTSQIRVISLNRPRQEDQDNNMHSPLKSPRGQTNAYSLHSRSTTGNYNEPSLTAEKLSFPDDNSSDFNRKSTSQVLNGSVSGIIDSVHTELMNVSVMRTGQPIFDHGSSFQDESGTTNTDWSALSCSQSFKPDTFTAYLTWSSSNGATCGTKPGCLSKSTVCSEEKSVLQQHSLRSHSTDSNNDKKLKSTCSISLDNSNQSVSFNPSPLVTPKNTPRQEVPLPLCEELKEKENCAERTSVVTKTDHQQYTEAAQGILAGVVDSLPSPPLQREKAAVPEIQVDSSAIDDHQRAQETAEPVEQDQAASSSDQNVTSDEDFKTPPDTPSKELIQAGDQEEKAKDSQDPIPVLKNSKVQLLAKAEVNQNDTLDDLADIIGGLSIESSKPAVTAEEGNPLDTDKSVPEASNDTGDILGVKEIETLDKPDIFEPTQELPEVPVQSSIVDDISAAGADSLVQKEQDTVLKEDISKSDTFDSGVVGDLDPLASVVNQKIELDSNIIGTETSDLLVQVEDLALVDLEPEAPKPEAPVVDTTKPEEILVISEDNQTNRIIENESSGAKRLIPELTEAPESLVCTEPSLVAVETSQDTLIKESLINAEQDILVSLAEESKSDQSIQSHTDTQGEQPSLQSDEPASGETIVPSDKIDNIPEEQIAANPETKVVFEETPKTEVEETPKVELEEAPTVGGTIENTLPDGEDIVQPIVDEEVPVESEPVETESSATQEVTETPVSESQVNLIDSIKPVDEIPVSAAVEVGLESKAPVEEAHVPVEEKQPSMDTDQAPESPILPKGSYNIDWDNFDDSMNPFETKEKVVSDFGSPPLSTNKVANSPIKDNKKAVTKPSGSAKKTNNAKKQPVKAKSPVKPSPNKKEEDVDAFKPSKAVRNSPPPVSQDFDQDIDPFKSKKALGNSPTTESLPSLDIADDLDPFKPRKAMSNSPPPKADAFDESVDPFKSKKALSNSPTVPRKEFSEDIDPFKSSKTLANSPPGSPKLENIDPFKSGKTLANSPPASPKFEEMDPFKSKKTLPNSPPGSPKFEEMDPFKSGKTLPNSPPASPKFDEIDPFKSKKTLPNSPPASPKFEELDPFKSKKTLSNSPPGSPKFEEIDPFKSKKTLPNSPPGSPNFEEMDPFKSGKALAITPPASPKLEDIDPFKSKRTLANSPPPGGAPVQRMVDHVSGDLDGEETNNNTSKVEPEPVKKEPPKKKTGTGIKKTVPRKFKPPPKQVQQDEGEDIQIFMPGQKPPPDVNKDEAGVKTGPEPSEAASEMTESQASNPCSQDSGVDTRSPPTEVNTEVRAGSEPPGIMEEDFREASEVFSDPSAWDMLEKFGSSNPNDKESTLSRQSLYVKFDPLVKGDSPAAQKVRSHLLQGKLSGVNLAQESDDLLLMSTPPAKDRSHHPAARALADKVVSGRGGEAGAPPSGLEAPLPNGDVDRILQCSPHSSPNGEQTSSTNTTSTSSLSSGIPPDMCESREQPYIPELTQSWFEAVKSLGDLDGDSAILSTDSLDCVDWVPKECGRPESPLKFDHEEIMRIDTSLNNSNKDRSNGTNNGTNNNSTGGNASKKDTNSVSRSGESVSDPDIIEVLKYSQADVSRMRREWELETRGTSLIKEREYMEQVQRLSEEKHELEEQNSGLKATADDMKDIVAQFEKTMTQLIAEKESSTSASKDSITDLIRERDQAYEDIQSVEAAFGDLHRRYEKTKQTLDGYKKNEDTLKKCVADYQGKLKKQDERYQALKAHAEEKLEQANDEIEKVRKSTETENARLTVALKRAEVKVSSLEADLERKSKEITELTAICDELISKVGH